MSEREIDRRDAFQLGPEVVVESFEDETIAVNLGSGRYYSVDPVGGDALRLLTSGRALHEVVALVDGRYAPGPESIESTLTGFTHRLLDEGLVVPTVKGAPGSTGGTTGATVSPPTPGSTFTPSLVVFSDMEDLLVLDPIHDVDAAGWPVRADPDPGEGSARRDPP